MIHFSIKDNAAIVYIFNLKIIDDALTIYIGSYRFFLYNDN